MNVAKKAGMSPAILCAFEPEVWEQALAEREAIKFFVHSVVGSLLCKAALWMSPCANTVTSRTDGCVSPSSLQLVHIAGPLIYTSLKYKEVLGRTERFLRRTLNWQSMK